MSNKPDIISRDKASSHPLRTGAYYRGVVTSVNNSGQVSVFIKAIKAGFDKITPVGTTAINKLRKNDVVWCTFTDEFAKDIIVFGPSKITPDVFADKLVVDDLLVRVAALEAQISSIGSSIAALEGE